jgi:hypothetical protein
MPRIGMNAPFTVRPHSDLEGADVKLARAEDNAWHPLSRR